MSTSPPEGAPDSQPDVGRCSVLHDDAVGTTKARGGAWRRGPARAAPATRRTPKLSGWAVAREMLVRGLSIDGKIVQGVEGTDIVRWRTGRRVSFALTNPDYVDHVLFSHPDRYHKSTEYELLRAVLGLSLFTDEDDSWRRYRAMLGPTFSKRHVNGLVGLMVAPIETFMDGLDTGEDVIPIEMTAEMTALTLDVVGSALFGRSLGSLARLLKPAVTSTLRMAEVGARLLMVFSPPVWVIRLSGRAIQHLPWLPWPLKSVQWSMRAIDQAVWDVIDERQRNPVEADDLLGLLLSAHDDEGSLSRQRVRDEATTFMLAGHETTANALAWMWYLLALNTDARDRMLEEVDAVLGDRTPTVEDLPKLPWTQACFQEAMRVFPPAWVIPRTALHDDLIDGHRIPKGSVVVIPTYAIHHDARYWDRPEEFDPARFVPGAGKGRHRAAYLPFGGGRRVCIGMSFALMEGTLITAMMSQKFIYDLVPGHPVEPEATLTLRPRHGVKMIARRRTPAQRDPRLSVVGEDPS